MSGEAATAKIAAFNHSWMAFFRANPDHELENLLRGYANIPPYGRAEIPDAAVQLFGSLDEDDEIWGQLDTALKHWFAQRRSVALPLENNRRRREISPVIDALRIVSRLNRTEVAEFLFDNRVVLTDWLTAFRQGGDRDAREQFFLTLAMAQAELGKRGKNVEVLAALWRDLCAEAGGLLPETYLSVGLLGLRNLPRSTGQSDVSDWLAGLLVWALAQNVDERSFTRKWLAMKSLYPRTPAIWRKEVGRLLSQPKIKAMIENSNSEVCDWWLKDTDLAVLAKPNAVFADHVRCPSIDDYSGLASLVRENVGEALRNRVPDFAQRHIRFARATGYDDFLCIGLHRLGRDLVKTGNDQAVRQAMAMAREMLRWQPFGSHGWSLWADGLEAIGAIDDCENVRREQLRRIPFKIDAYTQLAEFLIADGRVNEAQQIIESAVELGLENGVVRAIRIRLACHLYGREFARALFEQGFVEFPDHSSWPAFNNLFNQDKDIFLLSKHYLDFPLSRADHEVSDDSAIALRQIGRASRIAFALERTDSVAEAKNEIADLLAREPEFAFALLLAERHSLLGSNVAMTGFAISFERALRAEDIAMLEHLAAEMPRLAALTIVGRAIFGDPVAANEVEAWLRLKSAPAGYELFDGLRHWLVDRLGEARIASGEKVVSFADYVATNRRAVLAATRRTLDGLSANNLLAA